MARKLIFDLDARAYQQIKPQQPVIANWGMLVKDPEQAISRLRLVCKTPAKFLVTGGLTASNAKSIADYLLLQSRLGLACHLSVELSTANSTRYGLEFLVGHQHFMTPAHRLRDLSVRDCFANLELEVIATLSLALYLGLPYVDLGQGYASPSLMYAMCRKIGIETHTLP